VGYRCLGENALHAVVDLGGEEADVDVGFEVGVLIDSGEEGGGGDEVAEVDGDVAYDTVEGRTDLEVGELLLLGVGEGGVGFEIALGVFEGLDSLIVGLFGGDAGFVELALALDFGLVVLKDGALLCFSSLLGLNGGHLLEGVNLHE
jgi:hypothetical protein